jgi:5-methyltetrahydrofolate--homocysteine methyltransferase
MNDLTSDEDRETRLQEGRTPKEARRAAVAVEEAPAVPSAAVQPAADIPQPPFFGARTRTDFDLREVFSYINETALFKNQWQLKTASPEDYRRLVDQKYRPLRRELEEKVIAEKWFEPKAVYGFFPCQSDGNDLLLYEAPKNGWQPGAPSPRELQRFSFPRQRQGRRLSIADFFAARDSGRMDVVGLSVVTIGARASQETQKLFEANEYTAYLYLHGLSVETAEALAELLHKKMREELGIAKQDSRRTSDLFHQKYRGSRYSFGYPACPNLEDQTKIFVLLRPEETIGVRLTSGYQLEPEQSTSALVAHHPQAKYFVI